MAVPSIDSVSWLCHCRSLANFVVTIGKFSVDIVVDVFGLLYSGLVSRSNSRFADQSGTDVVSIEWLLIGCRWGDKKVTKTVIAVFMLCFAKFLSKPLNALKVQSQLAEVEKIPISVHRPVARCSKVPARPSLCSCRRLWGLRAIQKPTSQVIHPFVVDKLVAEKCLVKLVTSCNLLRAVVLPVCFPEEKVKPLTCLWEVAFFSL